MNTLTNYTGLIYGIAALVFAALIAFTMTPVARVLAFRIGAVDVPRDNRRMHKTPIPRMGGFAIYFAFTVTTLLFCEYTPQMTALWFGGLILCVLGIFDDVFQLNSWMKLIVQIAVAFIAVWQDVTIEFINFFGTYFTLGWLEIPVTVFWIVGLTNAINLIDGLDGLSCGVSAICSLSLLLVTLTMADTSSALLTAILVGSCVGFLPFNTNPAKIFMGDTGALFLGYTLALLSIGGVFKLHTLMSFLIPLSIFGLPLFDTAFAFLRRIFTGKNPFKGDRGHIHHRLIDMGFNQKQTVGILYAVCGILGISALMFTSEHLEKAGIIILLGFAIFAINFFIIRNPRTRELAGIKLPPMDECAHAKKADEAKSDSAKTDEVKTDNAKTDEVKADETKTEEAKSVETAADKSDADSSDEVKPETTDKTKATEESDAENTEKAPHKNSENNKKKPFSKKQKK